MKTIAMALSAVAGLVLLSGCAYDGYYGRYGYYDYRPYAYDGKYGAHFYTMKGLLYDCTSRFFVAYCA